MQWTTNTVRPKGLAVFLFVVWKSIGLKIQNVSGSLLNYLLVGMKEEKVVIEILWYNEMANLV